MWVVMAAAVLLLALVEQFTLADLPLIGFALAWGIAIGSIAMLQVTAGLVLDSHYDRGSRRAMIIGPLYPLFYWLIGAGAALTIGVPAFFRGPRSKRVVWDIPREEVVADSEPQPSAGQGVEGPAPPPRARVR
jgi:hypothetical protein